MDRLRTSEVSLSCCREMGGSFRLGWSVYGCAFDGQYSLLKRSRCSRS